MPVLSQSEGFLLTLASVPAGIYCRPAAMTFSPGLSLPVTTRVSRQERLTLMAWSSALFCDVTTQTVGLPCESWTSVRCGSEMTWLARPSVEMVRTCMPGNRSCRGLGKMECKVTA